MAITERGIQEIVARSVATMVHYHTSGRNPRTRELMQDDVRRITALLMSPGFHVADVSGRIFEALHAELLARYTPKIAASLQADFVAAFSPVEGIRLMQG
jgi:uncharacterized membrane protein